jgi:DNA mismatch repair ATPase MutS
VQHATPASVVVLDELGRGTSTFDGYAIAYAVLQHLSSQVGVAAVRVGHSFIVVVALHGQRYVGMHGRNTDCAMRR